MKIKSISIFQVPVEFGKIKYVLPGGRICDGLDGTLVRVDADCGLTGWGEISPWGRNYPPEFADGARGHCILAPDLIGQDPGNPARISTLMGFFTGIFMPKRPSILRVGTFWAKNRAFRYTRFLVVRRPTGSLC